MILMNIILPKHRKILLLALVFILLCVIFLLWWRLRSARGYKSAAGTYITTGGQSFLVIEPGSWRSLHVINGIFITYFWYVPLGHKSGWEGPISLSASFNHGRLIVKQKIIKHYNNEYYKEYLTLILVPSDTIPGDWDLVDADVFVKIWEKPEVTSLDFWKGTIKGIFFDENYMKCRLDPSKAPLRSFFHRVNDSRIPELFQSLLRGDYSQDILTLARDLVNDHQHDPYLDLLRIELDAHSEDPAISLKMLETWEKEYGTLPHQLLQYSRAIVGRNVSNAQLVKSFEKHPRNFSEILGKEMSLMERIARIKKLFYDPETLFYPMSKPFVPPIDSPDYTLDDRQNLLDIHVHAKVCHTLATFSLFQGQFGESLDLLCSVYRVGQSLNSHGTLIDRFIGMSVRLISCNGLEIFILNSCESPEDFQKVWKVLEKLNATPYQGKGTNLFEGEYPLLLTMMKMSISGYFSVSDYEEMIIRSLVPNMKFQLLRMATAAKSRLVTIGDFPRSEKEFGPLLPDGPPPDEFAEGKSLLFMRPSDDEFIVYSVGPDKKDDKARFAYDPTNGFISTGDIFIKIPREREYPFPKDGVKAKNAYELLGQFPNGLPVDNFADTKGRPFSIIESTENHPVVIFSFGPDTDEAVFRPYVKGSPGGDEESFVPVPTPAPPPNAFYGRSLQWVMRRSDKIPPPPGYWTLEPMYDPTNGTVSPGDLFLEIPK